MEKDTEIAEEMARPLTKTRAQLYNAEPPTLSGLLQKYVPHQTESIAFLNEHHIQTAEELEHTLQETESRVTLTSAKMKNAEKRLRTISNILRANETCEQHEAIHQKYLKTFWKSKREKLAKEHKKELDAYNRALRYLEKVGMEFPMDTDALRHEYAKLKLSHEEPDDDLKYMKHDLVLLNEIRLCMYDLIEQQGAKIPLPEMPEELQSQQEEEPQQRQEERTENAAQAYMRHLRETRADQKQQRSERKRTGDMER